MGKSCSLASSLAIIIQIMFTILKTMKSVLSSYFYSGTVKSNFEWTIVILSETIGSVDFQYKERKEEKERMV